MDVFEAIKSRRSIRAYKKETLPAAIVKKLLEAATFAPSAGNVQPWAFVVATQLHIKQNLSFAAYNQKDVEDAPAVIVVCADEKRAEERYGERGTSLYCIQDTAAAVQNLLLAAKAMGLGSCWVGAFKEEQVRKIVSAPVGMKPVALVPIGYSDEEPAARSRRPLDEVVHRETF